MLRSPTKRRAVDLGGEREGSAGPLRGPARGARLEQPEQGLRAELGAPRLEAALKGFFPKDWPPVAAASAAA